MVGEAAGWPPGAVDCHVHVVDRARFPYAGAGYRPRDDEQGTADDLLATLDGHGMAGALLVQPSCYGADAAAMRAARTRALDRLRLIAGIPAPGPEEGVVGLRLNLVNEARDPDDGALHAALAEAGRRGLWVAVQCPAPRLPLWLPALRRSGTRLLFDHMGYPEPRLGPHEPGFRAMLELSREGRHAVKLSGAFRLSRTGPPHADLDPFARAVLDAFGPQACVWGSDWPFLGARARPRYADTLGRLAIWVPEAEARARILVDTPRRLFGFPAAAPA